MDVLYFHVISVGVPLYSSCTVFLLNLQMVAQLCGQDFSIQNNAARRHLEKKEIACLVPYKIPDLGSVGKRVGIGMKDQGSGH